MIDFTKPVRTKDGRKVRILCTDHKNMHRPGFSVVGFVECSANHELLGFWSPDGEYCEDTTHNQLDLENIHFND